MKGYLYNDMATIYVYEWQKCTVSWHRLELILQPLKKMVLHTSDMTKFEFYLLHTHSKHDTVIINKAPKNELYMECGHF